MMEGRAYMVVGDWCQMPRPRALLRDSHAARRPLRHAQGRQPPRPDERHRRGHLTCSCSAATTDGALVRGRRRAPAAGRPLDRGGAGVQFRRLLASCDRGDLAAVRRRGCGGAVAASAARLRPAEDRARLAHAACTRPTPARPVLRLPRRRPVRSRARATASIRRRCCSTRTRAACSSRPATRGCGSLGPGSNAGRGPLGEIAPRTTPVRLGRRRAPAAHARHGDVRDARARIHQAAELRRDRAGPGTFAGVVEKIPYLKELGVTVVELMPVTSSIPRTAATTGATCRSNFFAPHQRVLLGGRRRRPARRVPRDGEGAARGGHRGRPRRRLQPHLRRRRVGPDLLLSRHRQQHLLPARPRRRRYRNDAGTGQRAAYVASGGAAADRRQPALLDEGDARRRLPLRPRVGLHAHRRRIDRSRTSRRFSPRSAAIPISRSCRLIAEPWDLGVYQLGRAFPGNTWAQWNGQFRDDVRAVRQGRRRPRRRPDVAALRQRRPVSRIRAIRRSGRSRASTSSRATTASACTTWSRTTPSTTSRTATGTATAPTTTSAGTAAWKATRARGRRCSRSRQASDEELLLPADAGERHADVLRRRRVHAHAGGQQQPLQPGQRDHMARLGSARAQRATCSGSSQQMIAFRKAHPSIGRGRFWRDDVRWYGVGRDVDL